MNTTAEQRLEAVKEFRACGPLPCFWELVLDDIDELQARCEELKGLYDAEYNHTQSLRAKCEELEKRKCSHGDYRMRGTDDCKNAHTCGGRTEFYVIGEGLCISCRHDLERGPEGVGN